MRSKSQINQNTLATT